MTSSPILSASLSLNLLLCLRPLLILSVVVAMRGHRQTHNHKEEMTSEESFGFSLGSDSGFVPAEHQKLIWPDEVKDLCGGSKAKLKEAYKNGVAEPDDAPLKYKGSGSEMKSQAIDQVLGKKTGPPRGVNKVSAPRAAVQHFHASPPPLCTKRCGRFLTTEEVLSQMHFAFEAVWMLESLMYDRPMPAGTKYFGVDGYPNPLVDKVKFWFDNGGEKIDKYIPPEYQPRSLVTNLQFRNQMILQTQQLFCNAFASSPQHFWRRAGHIMHMLTDAYSNSHAIRGLNASNYPDTYVELYATMDAELWTKHVAADSPMAAKFIGGRTNKTKDWQKESAAWMAQLATRMLKDAFLGAYGDGKDCAARKKPNLSGKQLEDYAGQKLAGFVKSVICNLVGKMDWRLLKLPAGGVWEPGNTFNSVHVDYFYSSVKTPGKKNQAIPWVPIGLGTDEDLENWVASLNEEMDEIRLHTNKEHQEVGFTYADRDRDYCQDQEPYTCQASDFDAEDSVAYLLEKSQEKKKNFKGGAWMTDLKNVKERHQ